MCLGVPGKVIEMKDGMAKVDILGAIREVSIELLSDVRVGDYVLVHAGCAIQKVDEQEAADTIRLFRELQEVMHE